MNVEFKTEGYVLTTDKKKLNTTVIHKQLSASEWTKGITFDTVKRSIKKSLCFGLYYEGIHVGFARVVSDYATLSYISDIFIIGNHNSLELLGWMVDSIMTHPEIKDVRNWLIKTDNDFDFYDARGFIKYDDADKLMIKRNS